MAAILEQIIRWYQKILSPDRGLARWIFPASWGCTMYPSCSEYMLLSIKKYGAGKGVARGVGRIMRCHPYQKKLIDPP